MHRPRLNSRVQPLQLEDPTFFQELREHASLNSVLGISNGRSPGPPAVPEVEDRLHAAVQHLTCLLNGQDIFA